MMICTENGFVQGHLSQKIASKSSKGDEKKAGWCMNNTETEDSHSYKSNDLIIYYNDAHQVAREPTPYINPKNLNVFSCIKEKSNNPAKETTKIKIKMGRRPGRPAKRGRKRKSQTKEEKPSAETNPIASKASREERKIKYYNDLIRKQEEREQKKIARKERKKVRQESRKLVLDSPNENIPLAKGNEPISQRSNFVSKKEEISLSIELVEDSNQFINPCLYPSLRRPDTLESSYLNKNLPTKDMGGEESLVRPSSNPQQDVCMENSNLKLQGEEQMLNESSQSSKAQVSYPISLLSERKCLNSNLSQKDLKEIFLSQLKISTEELQKSFEEKEVSNPSVLPEEKSSPTSGVNATLSEAKPAKEVRSHVKITSISSFKPIFKIERFPQRAKRRTQLRRRRNKI